jgi:hypothetical protein
MAPIIFSFCDRFAVTSLFVMPEEQKKNLPPMTLLQQSAFVRHDDHETEEARPLWRNCGTVAALRGNKCHKI